MLDTYEVLEQDGARRQPFGRDPLGLLIYAADGFMSAQLTRRDSPKRPERASGDYIAYSGRYSVDEATSTVTHQVTVSANSSWNGRSLERTMHFDGERLVLAASLRDRDGRVARHELAWRRAVSSRRRDPTR